MSVGLTGRRAGAGRRHDAETVAMFDTVTGWAFGPTFDGRGEARRFLAFADGQLGPDREVRNLSGVELEELYRAWLRSEDRTVVP